MLYNWQCMKDVIIAIPLYSDKPCANDLASLFCCAKILNKYDLCFFTHKNLDFSAYEQIFEVKKDCRIEYFEKERFKSVLAYSELCLSPELYDKFKDYKYMFLYQTDGWVFKDELEDWCNRGYDYIGAPWFEGFDNPLPEGKFIVPSGNGGVSLRNTEKFLQITRTLKNHENDKLKSFAECLKNDRTGFHKYYKAMKLYISKNNTVKYAVKNIFEDFFIVNYFQKYDNSFKIAPPEIAMKFSFEALPEQLYELNNRTLPFACHAHERYGKEFYKEFIKY